MAASKKYIKNSHIYGFFQDYLDTGKLQILTRDPRSLCENIVQDFKNEPRARVSLIRWLDQQYVLKYYNVKSPLFRLRRLLLPSLAWQKWEIVQGVKNRHIPTPELLASVDVGKRLHYKGTLCLYEFVKTHKDIIKIEEDFRDRKKRNVIIDTVVPFVRRMHQSGIYHGDAKIGNFLWVEKSGEVSLQIIDLDAVCFVDRLTEKQRLSDLSTLVTSLAWWDNDPSLASQCFQAYLRRGPYWCRDAATFQKNLQDKVARKLEKRKKTWRP